MKKYKLLKDIPQCKEGSIFTNNINFCEYHKDGNANDIYFQKVVVENNPEWFEEVIEKTWEIVSFKRVKDGDIRTLEDNWYAGRLTKFSLREMLYIQDSVANGACIIHSVKRLSDGEIFTVGNVFRSYLIDKEMSITSFRIENDNMIVNSNTHIGGEFLLDKIEILKTAYSKSSERTYSQTDMENAFNSARFTNSTSVFKYSTFQEWLKMYLINFKNPI